jgi:hypothetical protein
MLSLLGAAGNALRPYLLWLKIGALAVLCASSFWAGARWESAELSATLRTLEERSRKAEGEARRAANAELLRQIEARRSDEERATKERTKREALYRNELRRMHDYYLSNPVVNRRVDPERERLWRSSNGEPDPLPRTSPAPSAEPGASPPSASCTELDLHRNHADLVDAYREVGARLLRLQAWARAALRSCNEGTALDDGGEGGAPAPGAER